MCFHRRSHSQPRRCWVRWRNWGLRRKKDSCTKFLSTEFRRIRLKIIVSILGKRSEVLDGTQGREI